MRKNLAEFVQVFGSARNAIDRLDKLRIDIDLVRAAPTGDSHPGAEFGIEHRNLGLDQRLICPGSEVWKDQPLENVRQIAIFVFLPALHIIPEIGIVLQKMKNQHGLIQVIGDSLQMPSCDGF